MLDEADRLLELGFKAEVEEIVSTCPKSRQTLLFSATISEEVARLANISLNRPLQVRVYPTNNVPTLNRALTLTLTLTPHPSPSPSPSPLDAVCCAARLP